MGRASLTKMLSLHQHRKELRLGLKTTNAKGQAFKTPAPVQQTLRPERTVNRPSTIRRSGRSKITVAPTEPVHVDVLSEEEVEEPDYGYAPPPIKELDDPPIVFGYDQTFPQFKGANMFRGYGEIYCTSPTDEHGVSIRLKKEEEAWKNFDEERMREASKPMHFPLLRTEEELDAKVDAMIAAGPKKRINESRVDTVKAKSAAAMLSRPEPKLPSAATRTTKASEQKAKAAPRVLTNGASGSHPVRSPPINVSRNTIGFPKARKAPSIVPKADQIRQRKASAAPKVDQSEIHPREFVRLYGQPPVGSTMHDRLVEFELLEEELREEDEQITEELFQANFFGGQDDDEVFQLPMPE